MFVPHLEGHGEASHESPSMLEGFAEMGIIGKMEVIFIFIACFVQVALVLRQMRLRIQAPAFCAQIQKLVAAGNVERALKLCAAAPSSPVVILIKMGLEANQNKQSARAAMNAAYPRVLAATRAGLVPALVLAALAVGMGAVLIVESGVANIAIFPLGVVAIAGALNAMWFVAWPRELTLACDTLG